MEFSGCLQSILVRYYFIYLLIKNKFFLKKLVYTLDNYFFFLLIDYNLVQLKI